MCCPGIRSSGIFRTEIGSATSGSIATYDENFPQACSVAHQMALLPARMRTPRISQEVKSGGAYAGCKQKHWGDHGEIVRPRVAAVRAATSPCVQDARHPHPEKRDDPNGCPTRNRSKQTGNDRGMRNPPCKQAGRRAPQPIARAGTGIRDHASLPVQQEATPLSPARSA